MDQSALEQVLSNTDDKNDELVILQEIRQDDDNTNMPFPVQPPLETVGEFKVTPMIHAGYAFTWFGLASAGMVMTRKLITRGRS